MGPAVPAMPAIPAQPTTSSALQEKGQSEGGLERAVRPFSSLLGWAIIACGGLSVLHVMNVNIQPLLAVGGVGGLAVGFGAQVVTANALSGINLVSILQHLLACALSMGVDGRAAPAQAMLFCLGS